MRRHPDFSFPAPSWTWVDTFLVGMATAAVSAILLAFFGVFLLVG